MPTLNSVASLDGLVFSPQFPKHSWASSTSSLPSLSLLTKVASDLKGESDLLP